MEPRVTRQHVRTNQWGCRLPFRRCNLLGSSLFSADQIMLHSQTGTLPDIERTPLHTGWLGSRVVSVLDSGAEGPASNRSRYAVG